MSNEMWEGYAQKTLRPADMLTLQNHAAGCDMCADIKEGIDSLAHPETLPQIVAEIDTAVDEYLAPKRRKTALWVYWSAAAMLLIALGIGWYATPTQQGGVAGNMQTPVDTFTNTNTAPAKQNSDSVRALKTPDADITTPASQDNEKLPTPEVVPLVHSHKDFEGEKTTTTQEVNEEEKSKKLLIERSADADFQLAEELKKETPVYKETQAESATSVQISPTIKTKKRDIYPAGVLSNNMSNSYINNADINNSFSFNTTYQDSVNYNTAQALFTGKQYDSCNTVLGYITVNTLSAYYQQAQLLTAKTLIKQSNKAEAKALLSTVVFTDEKLKKEAEGLLKSIE
jgi:hypothetical protein